MSDYDQFLSDLHSKFSISDEILNNVVKKVVGKVPISKNRIIAGEVNEVYDLSFSSGVNVIARISRDKKPIFDKEKWAIDQCLKKGIPAPEVLLIERIELDGEILNICIQKKLQGVLLERGSISYSDLTKDQWRDYINQAGELLSKIHSISANGFGYLDGEGKGEFKSFNQLMDEHLDQVDIYLPIAKDVDFDIKLMKKAFEILNKISQSKHDIKPVLSHNDFGPKHILVKNEKISGIIDFGEVNGHSPINDFMIWDFWFSDTWPTEWLKEGYSDKSIFNQDFEEMLHWVRLNKRLGVLWWYHNRNYNWGIEKAKKELLKDIEYFS